MTPKELLRNSPSSFADMDEGTRFLHVIGDNPSELDAPSSIIRVVLCTGKMYWDLLKARTERKIRNVALIRVEQLAPFPFHSVAEHIKPFTNAEVVWCQEEPLNMGAWTYVNPRIETALQRRTRPRYIGRTPAAAPATGRSDVHKVEQDAIINSALGQKR